MELNYLDKIEKLDKNEMLKIRGGKEKPRSEDEIIIIRKRRIF